MQVTQEVVEQLAGIVREWAGSSRNASCALWSERELARAATAEDDLDAAQENKLRRLAQLAGVHTGMDVLEVGSGFRRNARPSRRDRGGALRARPGARPGDVPVREAARRSGGERGEHRLGGLRPRPPLRRRGGCQCPRIRRPLPVAVPAGGDRRAAGILPARPHGPSRPPPSCRK
ncbi:hypothetical protein DEH18_16965 [Streptomyces sp. NHF165]|nr:hypothetical protein DEH18_16965 [Streptomyces sp. NHF165]